MGAENGGMIVDISEDGLGFQAVGRVEKGAEIAVSFSLGAGYRISARARIAWVGANGNSGGTTFTRLPADSRSIIREWVTKTAEAEAARDAAAAVEAEITAPESKTEEAPLIIERLEGPRVPLPAPTLPQELAPETFVAAESLTESVELPAQEAIQPEIPEAKPLAEQPDISPAVISQPIIPQDVQSDVTAAAEPLVPSVVLPVAPPAAEPVAEPVIEEVNQQNLEPLVSQDVQHDAPRTAHDHEQRDIQTSESVSRPNIQPNLQPERDAPLAMQSQARKQSAASPADASRADVFARNASSADPSSADSLPPAMPLSPGTPPEIPAPVPHKPSTEIPENKQRVTQTPAAPPRAEPPQPLFPPRNTGELFSRSPWISGQSVPEEERSHKGLIAVIVICLIVAVSVASVPYIRSHRQQIGKRIEDMGRSVAGEPMQNASAPSQQPSPQSAQQPSQQTSQSSPQTGAPPSGTPSSAGVVIPANPSSAATKAPRTSTPSASAATPASQIRPNEHPADAASGAPTQNPAVASPLSANASATGSAALLATAGQTEFNQAQKYLNGTAGVAADPAEAAELFWRSLEKGNIAAAIPLADLYLEGKGVSQSCLQARILLTAASNKGNAEATQKLGQLPENCE